MQMENLLPGKAKPGRQLTTCIHPKMLGVSKGELKAIPTCLFPRKAIIDPEYS